MKNNILLFITVLSVGIITTFTTFLTSHPLESFCTICNGYKETSELFFQNGRIFSALVFNLFDILKLPYDSVGYISAFLINICLSLSVVILYRNLRFDHPKKIFQVLILLGTFTLFYNPLVFEIFMFDEGFIIALGILFITLTAHFINKETLKNYLIAALFMIIGVSCYQGVACYLFPLILLLSLSNSSKKDNIVIDVSKKIMISILIYVVAFLVSLAIVKIAGSVTGETVSKFGEINLFLNIEKIFSELLPETLQYMFSFTSVKLYYLISTLLLITLIYLIFKNEDKKMNTLLAFILILACVCAPFLPNLVMGESNYTSARMTGTIGIIPSVLMLFILIRFDITDKRILYVLLGLIFIFFIMNSRYFIQNGLIDSKRYKEDMKYLKKIEQKISIYESENDITVTKVYWGYDETVNYYYSFGYPNGANIRLMAVDWAFDCAFKGYTNHQYELNKMDDTTKEKLFGKRNYDELNDEQLIFDKDELYLLVY